MPTPHQVEIARAACELSVDGAAEQYFVARRTVQNHLYRTCAALEVSGQDGLAVALAPLVREPGWRLGADRTP